ncbi:hypothetical protein FEM48_Zijuj12G0115300 [Ziziphus jujuba var. spinosa]|uniref:protein GRAVITROPIC IN THE LIGHT 1-like n=2 Tax=Ziziphus jujuba TaxID=326968 RepID=A0A6P4ARI5_ZIZJJ|nr:hypothetical protein FEM48_Zijuj12G0115300 [Ziziphus jujuba var. spinosa]
MDSVKPSAVTPSKSKLARTIAKVLNLRTATGVAPVDGIQRKVKKSQEIGIQKVKKYDQFASKSKKGQSQSRSFELEDEEELQDRMALEALVAKLFAIISSVKASYAQLQYSQSPYDPDGIRDADQLVVSGFKNLSELKRCYLKKQFDPSPETAMLSAEIEELKSVLKTYEIMGKKLESQARLKDSEITFLKEKLEEANRQNKLLEKRLNQSGQLYVLDNLHLSGLNSSHFITVLKHTVKSIRTFVRSMMEEMKSAGWDFDAAASAIEPDVVYWKKEHTCFAFESFVCREMFDSFCLPNYSVPNELSLTPEKKKKQREAFFRSFMELKSMKAKEYLAENPKSAFGNFCRVKYLQVVHPKMESSFFGNLNQRNLVDSGEFPTSNSFFASFSEMAKRVWVLHCMAFSFETEAKIFQIKKGCRFSEVYMESVAEEEPIFSSSYDPQVAFTVVPGFIIGKTVIQCQVYLAQLQSERPRLSR